MQCQVLQIPKETRTWGLLGHCFWLALIAGLSSPFRNWVLTGSTSLWLTLCFSWRGSHWGRKVWQAQQWLLSWQENQFQFQSLYGRREINNNSACQWLLFLTFLYKHCSSFLPYPFCLLIPEVHPVCKLCARTSIGLEVDCHMRWEQTLGLFPLVSWLPKPYSCRLYLYAYPM